MVVNYSYNSKTSEIGPTWYHTDHLGSTNLLTDKDGNIIQHTEYYPYGETRVSEGKEVSQYKFTGQEFDRKRVCITSGQGTMTPSLLALSVPIP
jgi:uncharacterized protein RhaS with RHS repeats